MPERRRRVLHVDDDPGVRRAVERTLRAAGFAVTGAADGEEGIAAALRAPFDLAILDVDLPGASGFEVCARLRKERRTRALPVLHLSAARVDVRDRVQGLEGGADAYLVQPVAPEELVALARALVARGALARRARGGAEAARRAAAAREEAVRVATQCLRAPLSAIAINAAGLAAAAADPVSRARATALADAHGAAVQALADLGELVHLEGQRAALPLEPCEAGAVAGAAARRVAGAAQAAGVAVAVAAGGEVPLRCDAVRLERALELLLRRALREAARGASVTLRAEGAGEVARFSVELAGDGPAGEARALAAEDLWRARSLHGPAELGLALARAVVAAHGGRLAAGPGAGAVVVELPAAACPR